VDSIVYNSNLKSIDFLFGNNIIIVYQILFLTDISFELVKHPKTLCTPHLGASTTEAQLRVAREIAEQIVDAVNGKPMFGLVSETSYFVCHHKNHKEIFLHFFTLVFSTTR